ncbi:hypothetical protein Tco_0870028 [Tanacetum coccineum]
MESQSETTQTLVFKGPIPPKTAEQKLARKNELKAKITLLLAIPDERLLKFHGIKDAKSLWEAIKTRSKGLDKTYDRFQKLISQLEIHGEDISQEDVNLKLLRSLPSAWNNIALIMRNKYDLDMLSMDALYNNLKVYEAEIKGQSSSSSMAQESGNRNGDAPRRLYHETLQMPWLFKRGNSGYGLKLQAEEGLTNFALMTYTSQGSSSSSSSDSEEGFAEPGISISGTSPLKPKESDIKDLFGGEICTMMSPGGSIMASFEYVESFFAVHTLPDHLIRTDFEQEGVIPEVVFYIFEKLVSAG